MKLDGKVVLITGVVRESAPPAPDTWQAREQPSPPPVCPRTGFPRWLQHCRALATRLWHDPPKSVMRSRSRRPSPLELAHWLVEQQVALLVVETPSVASVGLGHEQELRDVHRALLEGGIVIVEGLCTLHELH